MKITLYYFTELSCVIFEALLIYAYLRNNLDRNNRSKYVLFGAFSAFTIIFLTLSYIPTAAIARILITVICIIGLTVFLFCTTLLKAIMHSLIFSALYVLNDILVLGLLTICGIDSQKIILYGSTRTLYLILTHLVLFGIISITSLVNKKHQRFISTRTIFVTSPCWIVSILLCCLLVSNVYITETELHWAYVIVTLGLLYVNILTVWGIGKIEQQEQEKAEAMVAAQHYEMQADYYEQFHKQQEEVRALWHDIHKYLRAAQAECSSSSSNTALSQVEEMLGSITPVVDVGNRIINIILNEYVTLATRENIKLTLDVSVPETLAITPADLYIILGNSLDNAFHACRQLPQDNPIISFQLRAHNELLYYKLINPYNIETQKSTIMPSGHGFGIKNIMRCVEKYDGRVEIIQGKDTFTLSAIISCTNISNQ